MSLSGALGFAVFCSFWLAVAIGVWSRLTPRSSNNIKALVFLVLGDVTPSWSSLTRGSADSDLRLTSLCPELGLGLEMEPVLEDSWSDGIFSLGLGAEDDDNEDDEGLEVNEELGLLVGILEMGLDMSPEPRLGRELLWWSEEGLVFDVEADEGLGVVEEVLGFVALDVKLGLAMGLLVVGLLSFSLL